MRTLRIGLAAAFCLMIGVSAGHAASPVLWGRLQAGPYNVGFRSTWVSDDSREFHAVLPGGQPFGGNKTPWPILVAEWYPAADAAEGIAMTQGDYLDDIVPASAGRLCDLALALADESRRNIISEVLGADSAKMTIAQTAELNKYLSEATAAHRNARPLGRQFPLVIYVHGFQSSIEDNTVLCEYLASYGFVVIDSAYQDERLHMIGGYQQVGDDLQFLIRYGRTLPNVNPQEVALVGHSGGAQSILAYQSRPGAVADALVSLDNTEDYSYLDRLEHKNFVQLVDKDRLTVPILFVADPNAIFQMADTLDLSHRYYLTERDTEHNEFISHGLASAIILNKPARAAIDEKYADLDESVLAFLNAALGIGPDAPAGWPKPDELPDFRDKIVNIENVPVGVSGPPPYLDTNNPPTPRQFRELVLSGQFDDITAVLRRFKDQQKWNPIYAEDFGFGLLDHLLEESQTEAARRVCATYDEVAPGLSLNAAFTKLGSILQAVGMTEYAARNFEFALQLNPKDAIAQAGLNKLRPTAKTP